MMTTVQSEVAADLDAYAEATWFSASFMVLYLPTKLIQKLF